MKPREFWDSTYREINLYLQTHLKREINLQEAVTNKLIRAYSMSKKPKIILIRDSYKGLYQEEKQEFDTKSPEEIKRKMREMMK